jgi:hypothetical protein
MRKLSHKNPQISPEVKKDFWPSVNSISLIHRSHTIPFHPATGESVTRKIRPLFSINLANSGANFKQFLFLLNQETNPLLLCGGFG